MRVTLSAAAMFAFVSAVLAQTSGFDAIYTPTKDESVTAGSTYTVTWDYTSTYAGTISIQLLQGASSTTLQLGEVIASGIDNAAGTYSWAVDSSLGADATYGLKIIYDKDSSIFQYSNPFAISAAAAATSSSAAAAAPATTSAPAANGDSVQETIYQTQLVTITSCAADITNCPARSTVVSSTLIPITSVPAVPAVPTSSAPEFATSNSPVQGSEPAPSSAAKTATGAFSPSGSAPSAPSSAVKTTTQNSPVASSAVPNYPVNNGTATAATTLAGTGVPATTLKTTASAGLSSTSTASEASGTSTPVPVTAGASRMAAGSLALVGGLVAAFFAL